MRLRLTLTSLTVCALSLASFGQGCGLVVGYDSDNGQDGNMFDIVATNPAGVTITGFNVNALPGTWNFEVWIVTGGGTMVGNDLNPGAWTMVGSATGVQGQGLNVPTPLPIALSVFIPNGTTQGFYVTGTAGFPINYTNGNVVGGIRAMNPDLQVLEGYGNQYPFAATFQPRNFNGEVFYTYPGQTFDYQTNSSALSLDINGVQATSCSPAITTDAICGGIGSATFNLSSVLPGNLFEVGISAFPVVPLATTLPEGIVNLDITQPISGLFGGPGNLSLAPLPDFPSASSVAMSFGISLAAGNTLSFQGFVVAPGMGTGLGVLSQASQWTVTVAGGGGTIPGPTGDDTSVNVDLTAPPLCLTGGFTFYGTTYTSIDVESNGRIMFGGADSDFSPTLAEALTDNPFCGFWCDLSPNAGGSITIGPGGQPNTVRVDYTNVPYFGGAAPGTATYAVTLDAQTFQWTLSGLQGIGANGGLAGDEAFLGCSGGIAVGATDPGPVNAGMGFAPAAFGQAAAATDMLYDFLDPVANPGQAVPVTVMAGTNNVVFTPIGNNYGWLGN